MTYVSLYPVAVVSISVSALTANANRTQEELKGNSNTLFSALQSASCYQFLLAFAGHKDRGYSDKEGCNQTKIRHLCDGKESVNSLL